MTGDLRSKNRHKNFPAGQKLLQPAGKGRNAAQIANEDEKSHKEMCIRDRVTPRLMRANSCTPNSSSSPAIIWLMPDWV